MRKTSLKKPSPSISFALSKEAYFEGVGRRKTAAARVRLYQNLKKEGGIFLINERDLSSYFPLTVHQETVLAPLKQLNVDSSQFKISVKVKGGGISSQAEAVRHGLSRALLAFNQEFKKKLRNLGFLTRDARVVERKKYGLKKARRAPQWSKR